MQISVVGLAICLALFGLGRSLGSALIVGMIASTAFGATAIVTLSAVGGSSPLIYVVFALLVCSAAFLRRDLHREVTATFKSSWVPWVVCGLAIYAAATALILPRLFAGATSAFMTARGLGIVEISLSPSSGNVTQTGYFILGALTFLALAGALLHGTQLQFLRRGFLAWAAINAAAGIVDLAGKSAGFGDVLSPIRTASYAYLTDVEQAGFWRISGTYSEASAFGAAALAALAFTYAYWKRSGSRVSGTLAALLLMLILLSTSSTANAGLIVLGGVALTSVSRSALRGLVTSRDALVFAALACLVSVLLLAMIYDPRILEPFQKLFQATLIDKSQSESGQERNYWNERSLTSLLDTWGLGIGFGSSRASNWIVAVVSQLGLIGALMQFALLIPLLTPPPSHDAGAETLALYAGLRACMAAVLLGNVLSGGSADPGLLFFVALAGMLACRPSFVAGERSSPRRTGLPGKDAAPMTQEVQ